jgi:hypothetical protein
LFTKTCCFHDICRDFAISQKPEEKAPQMSVSFLKSNILKYSI